MRSFYAVAYAWCRNTPANKTAIADDRSYLTHKETAGYETQVAYSREFVSGGLYSPVMIQKLV